MASASKLGSVSTRQQRIATLAKQSSKMGFTSLAYLIDLEWLREAYRRTRKDGATGVDGQTATEYAANLEVNLQSLLDRAKSGTYRAPPVRRVYIPKGGSTTETRPIGIPTFEDKVLQRAVALTQKLQGHYAYFGITGNAPALHGFYRAVRRIWKKWLGRRSQRGYFTWPHYARLLEHYPLPRPVVVHSVYRP